MNFIHHVVYKKLNEQVSGEWVNGRIPRLLEDHKTYFWKQFLKNHIRRYFLFFIQTLFESVLTKIRVNFKNYTKLFHLFIFWTKLQVFSGKYLINRFNGLDTRAMYKHAEIFYKNTLFQFVGDPPPHHKMYISKRKGKTLIVFILWPITTKFH